MKYKDYKDIGNLYILYKKIVGYDKLLIQNENNPTTNVFSIISNFMTNYEKYKNIDITDTTDKNCISKYEELMISKKKVLDLILNNNAISNSLSLYQTETDKETYLQSINVNVDYFKSCTLNIFINIIIPLFVCGLCICYMQKEKNDNDKYNFLMVIPIFILFILGIYLSYLHINATKKNTISLFLSNSKGFSIVNIIFVAVLYLFYFSYIINLKHFIDMD